MPNYLYNGVELPALPEWDKESYPYAIITRPVLGSVDLFFLREWEYYYYADGTLVQEGIKYKTNSKKYVCRVGGIEWEQNTIDEEGQVIFPWILWTSEDVVCQSDEYKPAGTLYLAASDPVPVLSLTDSDLYRNVNGKLVKHTLYKKVGGEFVPLDDHIIA